MDEEVKNEYLKLKQEKQQLNQEDIQIEFSQKEEDLLPKDTQLIKIFRGLDLATKSELVLVLNSILNFIE